MGNVTSAHVHAAARLALPLDSEDGSSAIGAVLQLDLEHILRCMSISLVAPDEPFLLEDGDNVLLDP